MPRPLEIDYTIGAAVVIHLEGFNRPRLASFRESGGERAKDGVDAIADLGRDLKDADGRAVRLERVDNLSYPVAPRDGVLLPQRIRLVADDEHDRVARRAEALKLGIVRPERLCRGRVAEVVQQEDGVRAAEKGGREGVEALLAGRVPETEDDGRAGIEGDRLAQKVCANGCAVGKGKGVVEVLCPQGRLAHAGIAQDQYLECHLFMSRSRLGPVCA